MFSRLSYGFLGIIICSTLAYGVLTQLSTGGIYETRSLDKSLREIENNLAKNRALLLKSAQEPDKAVTSLLSEMQPADVGISYLHQNMLFVDASRPQP